MGLLAAFFFVTALLYASVGFGGGSTYNALLVLAGTDYAVLPMISLACNIVVVTGGTWTFARAGAVPWRRVWPVLLLSAPCAWIGGRIAVDKNVFIMVLGGSLLVAALLILLQRDTKAGASRPSRISDWLSWPIGMGVGFLSGLVGIGGGIFLSPILHLMRWEKPRAIAGTASAFILVNSIAGLWGQLAKTGLASSISVANTYWPLLIAVLVGGQIGSHIGARILPQRMVRIATGLLILYVAVCLLVLGKQ